MIFTRHGTWISHASKFSRYPTCTPQSKPVQSYYKLKGPLGAFIKNLDIAIIAKQAVAASSG